MPLSKRECVGRTLGIDATTVSRKVRALEQELACTLFELTRDGHALTSDGRRLLVSVEAMERAATSFDSEASTAGSESGLVRVSVAEGFGTWFVAPRIGTFARDLPMPLTDLKYAYPDIGYAGGCF